MKFQIPREQWNIFDRLPRKDRRPFSEVAAVQFFRLAGWATVTGGIYLLQQRSGVAALKAIPYLVWSLIVWDMCAKLGYEPAVERSKDALYVLLPRSYWAKLVLIGLFSAFVAWATVFWLAPLINRYGLANL
jgi:hypothetical protein